MRRTNRFDPIENSEQGKRKKRTGGREEKNEGKGCDRETRKREENEIREGGTEGVGKKNSN